MGQLQHGASMHCPNRDNDVWGVVHGGPAVYGVWHKGQVQSYQGPKSEAQGEASL